MKFPPKVATIVSKRVLNALRKADFGGEDTEIENTIKTTSNSKVLTGIKINFVLVKLACMTYYLLMHSLIYFSLLKEKNSEVNNLHVVKRF